MASETKLKHNKHASSKRTDSKKSQAGAKEAIGTFCKLLQHTGTIHLTPEVLRQAKFDRQDAVLPMWELLYRLTSFAQHREFPKQDTTTFTTNLEQTLDEIKQILWYYGYRCSDFFHLPLDLSSGSQDILLASGWLIAKTQLMPRLMESRVAPFLEGDTSFLYEGKPRVSKTARQGCCAKTASGQVKYLVWKAGQCKMAWRGLYMKQQQFCNLAHQIHKATQGVSTSSNLHHLSQLETFLLRHPNHMQKYQGLLNSEIHRLQTCVKWKEQEHVFWQWMESVLDTKLSKDQSEDTLPAVDNFTPISASNTYMQTSVELGHLCKELGQLISQIQDSVWHLPEEQNQLISEDIELIKQDIAAEVEKEITSLRYQKDSLHHVRRHQPIRLQYIPPTDKGVKNSRTLKPIDGSLNVRDEIDRWEAVVRDLESQHRDLQETMKQEMEMIGQKFSGVVCIPPMGKTK